MAGPESAPETPEIGPESKETLVMAPPERVLTAMVTPFTDLYGLADIDRRATEELANYLLENGSDGLVLAGTTGESPTLSPEEQLDLFEVVRKSVGEDVKLVGGTGSNNPLEAAELTEAASKRGHIDELLVVTPYYNKPTQTGIIDYFRQVRAANHNDLPTILYNIPGRTGGKGATVDTISTLFEEGAIQAVKDATGSVEIATELTARFGSEIIIYSGDDGKNLEFARAGAIGAISVASHWAGREISAMFEAFFRGDEERAEAIGAALAPSAEFETVHTDASGVERDVQNPIPAKVMMAHILGRDSLRLTRSPILASDEDMKYLDKRAPAVLRDLKRAMAKIGS